MYNFSWRKATSIEDAVSAIRNAEDGKFIAGGQTLLPTLKHRLASHSHLIDLGGIDGLADISLSGDTLTIGAMSTHAAVASAPAVAQAIPALAQMAAHIGDPAVRNRGTIGGSIANNDPAADWPAAVIALNATVRTNRREIAGDEFFTGMFETALEDDELITAVNFPRADAAAYMKFPNPASRYAIVGVFVAMTGGAVRVAVTGATPCAHRALRIETALNGKLDASAVDDVAIPVEKMNADIHASAEYRAHLVKVMAKRAVRACA